MLKPVQRFNTMYGTAQMPPPYMVRATSGISPRGLARKPRITDGSAVFLQAAASLSVQLFATSVFEGITTAGWQYSLRREKAPSLITLSAARRKN